MATSDDALDLFRLHAEICKVLTDPKRLMILDGLRAGDRSVGELAERIGVTLANASQHLAVLRAAGLVDGRRSGTTVVYRLAEPAILEACDVIHAIVERRLAGPALAPRATATAVSAPPAIQR
jgi:DNA-binding transcriptional ArsR family regulator